MGCGRIGRHRRYEEQTRADAILALEKIHEERENGDVLIWVETMKEAHGGLCYEIHSHGARAFREEWLIFLL